jgi:5'-3' exonuclease
MKTIIVDGEWNLKRNYMKRTDLFAKGEFCGGSFGFIDSLRSVVNQIMPDRVIVMWDGMMSGKLRHDIYPAYKANRNKSWDEYSYLMTDEVIDEESRRKYSILQQKIKVKNYLEELFVRQAEVDKIEADDLIAYYVLNKPADENVIIFSSDKDYYQLIDENVSVLRPSDNKLITNKNFMELFGYTQENALCLRCFEGDDSDNITGIDGIGLTTILKYFPDFKTESYNIDRLIQEAVSQYNVKKYKNLEKIIGCRRVFERNKKLMDLKNPLITEEAKEEVIEVMECIIVDDESYVSRSISNAIKMSMKDGFQKFMYMENVEAFFRPFYQLVVKEKEYAKKLLKD